jgi:serine/threonine protein kinase
MSAAPTTSLPTEPIPGYVIRERLGAGGYGEVWKADAPGGLSKAVKIVYGRQDDERAAAELAALNRIKEVRHPFLLSIERIERVDGRLVILTELATSNLKQEFDNYRGNGQIGIPRSELLAHLHDAADALDYICEQYCLQHLDIKPENLLLVGGRIKVADFGLVKDLQDANMSLVGGMTPAYAAPELFDGRPSIHSDQYSLAIVYQEMLTGALPFDGRTTAQLAAQHMHSRPRLDRLPSSDEATIARALAKDPNERFSSCREMIEGLLDVTPNARPRAARPVRPKAEPVQPAEHSATEMVSHDEISTARMAASRQSTRRTHIPDGPAPASDLPPLPLDHTELQLRPTLFIGIGGLAIRTLETLRERIHARFGDPSALTALQFLAFDTDAASLRSATESGAAPLRNDSAVLLPLRPMTDYRGDTSGRFHWLSRRWIYNIPRNLQTQGLRPLARLALVDNMERVIEPVTRALRAATDPAGIVVTTTSTGLPFRNPAPRVFIVATTTGGTGSGTVLDFGYIVRQVLRELQLPDNAVCGVLAHCTGRNSQQGKLPIVNAYALLGELNHYMDPQNAYPGDPAAGLSSFTAEDAPFNHAYLVHLGEELDGEGFAGAVDTLAKYLYSGSMTGAAAFFDRCREAKADDEASAAFPTLRTFGYATLGFSADDAPSEALDELCRGLVARWQEGARDEQPAPSAMATLSDPTSLLATHFAQENSLDPFRAEVAARAAHVRISLDGVVARFNARLAEQMGNDRESYLTKVLEELANNFAPQKSLPAQIPPGKVIVHALDRIVRHQGADDAQRLCLESALDAPIQEILNEAGPDLQEWLLGLVNSRKRRLNGALAAADQLAEHLREITQQAIDAAQSLAKPMQSLRDTLASDPKAGKNWLQYRGYFGKRRLEVDRGLSDYFELRLHELVLNAFCRLARQVLSQIKTVQDKLRIVVTELHRLFPHDSVASMDGDAPRTRIRAAQQAAAQQIAAQSMEIVDEMEQALEPELCRLLATEASDARRLVLPIIRTAAMAAARRKLRQHAEEAMTAAFEGGTHHPLFGIPAAAKAAVPACFQMCGGRQRLLVVAPESLAPAITPDKLGDGVTTLPTVVADPYADMLVCYEVEGLSLPRIATAVLDQRFQVVEAAARLHTRSDISWTPL